MLDLPKFLHAGDRGLTVELGNTVDEATNDRVVALDQALQSVSGILETVPTYRSLLILFDPNIISKAVLQERVVSLWPLDAAAVVGPRRRFTVPVLYGGAAGEDLPFVASAHGLSLEEVVQLHSSVEYRVYMIGFAPGFAYLGGLPERLHTSRRADPRMRIPRGSISIGGKQAAICPHIEIPSGWHLLGRTPVRTYDPARSQPFLLNAGDRVFFEPISEADYAALDKAAEAGDPVARVEAIGG